MISTRFDVLQSLNEISFFEKGICYENGFLSLGNLGNASRSRCTFEVWSCHTLRTLSLHFQYWHLVSFREHFEIILQACSLLMLDKNVCSNEDVLSNVFSKLNAKQIKQLLNSFQPDEYVVYLKNNEVLFQTKCETIFVGLTVSFTDWLPILCQCLHEWLWTNLHQMWPLNCSVILIELLLSLSSINRNPFRIIHQRNTFHCHIEESNRTVFLFHWSKTKGHNKV